MSPFTFARFFSFAALLFVVSCSSSGDTSLTERPLLLAIDAANDRMFIMQNRGRFLALRASDRAGLGNQPLVSRKRLKDIYEILPTAPTNMAVADIGGVSRIFMTGAREGAGLNEILVLDFDGEELVVSDVSPLIVEDGSDATDNTSDILGGMLVDAQTGVLYVTNTTTGALFSYHTDDVTEASAPVALSGSPNKMSLSDNHLYIANATAENVLVVDVTDNSVSAIDLGTATNDLAVVTNSNGTVLVARDSTEARVLVRQVGTSDYASSTAILAGDTSVDDGEINSDNSVEAAVGPVNLALGSDDNLYSYIPLADGNILMVTIESDLSSFTSKTRETSLEIFTDSEVLTDDAGVGITVFMTASGTGDLLFVDVGSTVFDAVL